MQELLLLELALVAPLASTELYSMRGRYGFGILASYLRDCEVADDFLEKRVKRLGRNSTPVYQSPKLRGIVESSSGTRYYQKCRLPLPTEKFCPTWANSGAPKCQEIVRRGRRYFSRPASTSLRTRKDASPFLSRRSRSPSPSCEEFPCCLWKGERYLPQRGRIVVLDGDDPL